MQRYSTKTRADEPGITMRALLADEQFAARFRRVERLKAKEQRQLATLRRLIASESALLDAELRRRIIEALRPHPRGMFRMELVRELGMERATRWLSDTLAAMVKEGLLATTLALGPTTQGFRRQRRYRLAGVVAGVSQHASLRRPDHGLRVIPGGRS